MGKETIFPRHLRPSLVEALGDTRIVFVVGARQVGKTTLTSDVTKSEVPMTRFTFDDQATRDAAMRDPTGFIAGLAGPTLIDEVQRAPDVLLAIKDAVDRDQASGRFLLTGSANILTSKRIKDALTGRVETLTLWPLSQSEIANSDTNLIDALFAASPPRITQAPTGRDAFASRIVSGGYPEARLRTPRRREAWFENYLNSALERDLRDITDAVKTEEMPRLLRLLATQAANMITYRGLATKLDLSHETVKAYIGLLEQMFLVKRLPGWRPGLGAREVAKPKIYVVDSGMHCHLMGADEERVATDDQVTGKALENFVAMEVMKHQGWAKSPTRLHHYQRDRDDVDLILEQADGRIVAIEVKASATLKPRDYRWLEKLREERKKAFVAGIVVCTTSQTTPLGDRLWAVPVSGLWSQ